MNHDKAIESIGELLTVIIKRVMSNHIPDDPISMGARGAMTARRVLQEGPHPTDSAEEFERALELVPEEQGDAYRRFSLEVKDSGVR